MAVVCPSILAGDKPNYDAQIERVAGFAHRIQIDLTDGQFAKGAEINPSEAWWPAGVKADFHLMYKNALEVVRLILPHRPHLVIVHAEADGDFNEIKTVIKSYGVKVGLALLPGTMVQSINTTISELDHVLIFSGDLGSFGGTADLSLLEKARQLKQSNSSLEVGWDGGVNDQNIAELAMGGIDVINSGGFIQNAENPHHAYAILERIAEEAGTT